jgi:hypothetical protein
MESGDTKRAELETKTTPYEPPAVLKSYSVDELRRAAAESAAVSSPPA